MAMHKCYELIKLKRNVKNKIEAISKFDAGCCPDCKRTITILKEELILLEKAVHLIKSNIVAKF